MPTIKIPITTEHIELNQLLKLAGLAASGGGGKALVAEGGVTVDGVAELRKTAKIRAGQVVKCGEARIRVVAAVPGGEVAVAPAVSARSSAKSSPKSRTKSPTKSPAKSPTKNAATNAVNQARRPAWAGKTIRRSAK